MIIRNIELEDFEKVNLVMREVHALHVKKRPDLYKDVDEPYPRDQFISDIQNENMITVLAEENNEILGICMVSFREQTCMVKKRTAYMDVLCVSEPYRRRGIGTSLFLYVQEATKMKGAERLDLMVWGFNERAYTFYEKLGMSVQRFILEKNYNATFSQ